MNLEAGLYAGQMGVMYSNEKSSIYGPPVELHQCHLTLLAYPGSIPAEIQMNGLFQLYSNIINFLFFFVLQCNHISYKSAEFGFFRAPDTQFLLFVILFVSFSRNVNMFWRNCMSRAETKRDSALLMICGYITALKAGHGVKMSQ